MWMRTGVEVNFTAWGVGEPNNLNGIENCLHMNRLTTEFKWNDLLCQENLNGPAITDQMKPLCQK